MVDAKGDAKNVDATDSAMDVSGVNSAIGGEDVGNLYETLDKIVEGVRSSAASVTEEDLSLSDLMGLIGEGGEKNKVELEVAEGDINGVKCESGDMVNSEGLDSAETNDGGEAAKDSAPLVDDSGINDSVITIGNPVEVVKTAEGHNESGSVGGDANSASESGCSGATVSAIQTIPKYRLREIFRHANGNICKLPCYFFLYR